MACSFVLLALLFRSWVLASLNVHITRLREMVSLRCPGTGRKNKPKVNQENGTDKPQKRQRNKTYKSMRGQNETTEKQNQIQNARETEKKKNRGEQKASSQANTP